MTHDDLPAGSGAGGPARYEAWARFAAQALTLRPFPPDVRRTSVEEVLLKELSPISGGELHGAPAFLEGSLPSRFWDAASSLAYALSLPAWLDGRGPEDRFVVGGEEGPRGLILRGLYGPPGGDRSFVISETLEELACSDREGLRRLWRKISSEIPPTSPDE